MGLEARYRRLLLAYPRHYRHRRGNEILTTLMDGADPARERPELADVLDILRGGMKARFGTGGGKFAVLLATVAALIAGAAGLCVGSWAGWQTAPHLPESVPGEIATLVFPGLQPDQVWRQPYPYGYRLAVDEKVPMVERVFGTANDLDGPQMMSYGYNFLGNISARQMHEATAGAVARLRHAGWHVVDRAGSAVATRDGVVASIYYADVVSPQFDVTMSAGPNNAAVAACSIAGVLAGMVIGWIIGAWALRRLRRTGYPTRGVMGLLFGLACVVLTPAAAGVVSAIVPGVSERPVWVLIHFMVIQPGIVFAGLLFAIILIRAWRVRAMSTDADPYRLSAT
jgi:hypothetical protein